MSVSETMSTENSGIEEELKGRVNTYEGNPQVLQAAMRAYVGSRAPARLLEIVSEITSGLLDLKEEELRVLIKKIMH